MTRNSTRVPTRSRLAWPPSSSEWTNTSSPPSSGAMNPNPRATLNCTTRPVPTATTACIRNPRGIARPQNMLHGDPSASTGPVRATPATTLTHRIGGPRLDASAMVEVQAIDSQQRRSDMQPASYPVTLSVDYPDRPLNRVTTGFRIFVAIPIAIVLAAVDGGGTVSWSSNGQARAAAVGA